LLMVPPAVVEDAVRPAQLARELRQPLVRLRPTQLHARALGAGNAGALVRAEGPVVREAERLQLDPLAGERLAHERSGIPLIRLLQHPPEQRVERRREREAERRALVQEGRHSDLPAVALVAQAVLDRHLDIAEEDLVEL